MQDTSNKNNSNYAKAGIIALYITTLISAIATVTVAVVNISATKEVPKEDYLTFVLEEHLKTTKELNKIKSKADTLEAQKKDLREQIESEKNKISARKLRMELKQLNKRITDLVRKENQIKGIIDYLEKKEETMKRKKEKFREYSASKVLLKRPSQIQLMYNHPLV